MKTKITLGKPVSNLLYGIVWPSVSELLINSAGSSVINSVVNSINISLVWRIRL